jgi:hypothetical protein
MAWSFLEIVALIGVICAAISAINALISILEKVYTSGESAASFKKIQLMPHIKKNEKA